MDRTDAIIARLESVLGSECVLASAADRYLYGTDASRRRGACACAVRPRTEEQVSALLALADEESLVIVPRGAGTSATGSALPLAEDVVALDLTAMNRILDVDARDLVAEVEPGVLTGTLQAAVAEQGLFYPPDPASSRFSTLGGNVATCAGGLRAVKYGVTRDYVLGLRAVLVGGRVLELGGRSLKDVAGYDLVRLLVGSEGTLAVFTRLTLRLIPAPETSTTLLASFGEVAGALAAADQVLGAGLQPRALEYMDRDVLTVVASFRDEAPPAGTGSRLLLELDGGRLQVAADTARTLQVLQEAGALDVLEALPGPERDALWEERRCISQAVWRSTPGKLSEDIGVPRGRLAEAIAAVKQAAAAHGIRVLAYGHAGDANLHCNFLYDPDETGVQPRLEAAVNAAFEEVLARGGTISGEHGIGLSKRAALEAALPLELLELQRGIKQLFDPRGLLNPDKVLADPRSE